MNRIDLPVILILHARVGNEGPYFCGATSCSDTHTQMQHHRGRASSWEQVTLNRTPAVATIFAYQTLNFIDAFLNICL